MSPESAMETVRRATDHFAVFSLPRRYGIDPAELERRYLELSRATHPDLAGSEPESQLEAMELSSRVNEAYECLGDGEKRANYLLGLLGGPASEADKSLPEGFLPIIMMTREELAEAQLEGDEGRVKEIEADARAQREARLKEVAGLLERAIYSEPADAAVLKAARTELNALRYYERLLEQMSPGYEGL